ncbi:hypothetical protein KVT40_009255 [Elsinoe batatas]|uniref:Uncharacterized protein n=1 Tax=Elsinoe batatas TaxID=2601811 RepID=A0A8K0KUM2_9PEZI|nr:hypothetical protein KVT40_009255 [Elsinoe batatas]
MNQATSSLGNDTHSSAVAIGAANVPHLADHTKDMCNLPAPRSSALPDVGTAVMVAQTEPATTNTCLTSDTSIFRPTTELDPRWASEVPDDIVSGAMAPANSDICIVCAAPSASADHHTTAIPCFSCGRNSHEDCIREYRELGLYGCPLFKCCGNGPTAWGMCLESFNTADMSNVPLPSVVSASMTILPWASVTSHAPSPNIGGIDFEAAASFASPSQVGNGERTLLSPLGPNTVKETLLPNRTAETATEYDSADDISTSIHEWDSIADFGTQIDPDGSLHRDNSFLNAPQFEEDFDQSMYESSIDFSSGSSTSHDISETDAAPSDASMTPQSLFGPQSPMDWGCSA